MFVCQAFQVQSQLQAPKDVIPREAHEDEMEEMRREVQQCKEFIQAQQQLLQVSLAVGKGLSAPRRCNRAAGVASAPVSIGLRSFLSSNN